MSEIKFNPPKHIAFRLSNGTTEVIFADKLIIPSRITGDITLELKGQPAGRINRAHFVSWKQIENNESDNPPPIGSYSAP